MLPSKNLNISKKVGGLLKFMADCASSTSNFSDTPLGSKKSFNDFAAASSRELCMFLICLILGYNCSAPSLPAIFLFILPTDKVGIESSIVFRNGLKSTIPWSFSASIKGVLN